MKNTIEINDNEYRKIACTSLNGAGITKDGGILLWGSNQNKFFYDC